jgi:hypothetical protein
MLVSAILYSVVPILLGLAPPTQADDHQKMLDDIAKKQSSWLPLSDYAWPLVAYAVVGLIVLGNWKNLDSGKRFFTFLLFPAHVVIMYTLGGTFGGVRGIAQQGEVRLLGGVFVWLLKALFWIALIGAFILFNASM